MRDDLLQRMDPQTRRRMAKEYKRHAFAMEQISSRDGEAAAEEFNRHMDAVAEIMGDCAAEFRVGTVEL